MKSFAFLGFVAGVAALGRPVTGRALAGRGLLSGQRTEAEQGLILLRLWRRRARDRRRLTELGDHVLKDIGITPERRQLELSKPFWR